MSLALRVLPPEEWPKLAGLEIAALLPWLVPEDTRVLVVEDNDAIVGVWAATRVVHLEGVWIDPAYRRQVPVVRRLLRGAWSVAKAWGAKACWTGAQTDEVRALIQKLHGQELAMTAYVVPVPSGEWTCQP